MEPAEGSGQGFGFVVVVDVSRLDAQQLHLPLAVLRSVRNIIRGFSGGFKGGQVCLQTACVGNRGNGVLRSLKRSLHAEGTVGLCFHCLGTVGDGIAFHRDAEDVTHRQRACIPPQGEKAALLPLYLCIRRDYNDSRCKGVAVLPADTCSGLLQHLPGILKHSFCLGCRQRLLRQEVPVDRSQPSSRQRDLDILGICKRLRIPYGCLGISRLKSQAEIQTVKKPR